MVRSTWSAGLVVVLALIAIGLIGRAFAEPVMLQEQHASNLTRPCSHKGITPVSVTSGTNGATGSTASVTTGSFVVYCQNNVACLGQASTASAAITASANTHCNGIPKGVPIEKYSEATDIVALTAASGETASACTVTSCR